MEKYDSYKDSGVEWIGEIPSHWEAVPLKRTGSFGNGLTYSPSDVCENGVLVLRSSNIQNSKMDYEDCVYVNSAPNDLMVQKGDIIICSRNGSAALVGKCAIVDDDINATFGAFMMRYIPFIDKMFGYYLFQTAISFYKGLFATTTINQLTNNVIDQMFVSLPPNEEQTAIANYLDTKCSKIDNVIATQEKRVELLRELKQSIITRAVTRGINPNAKLKDSGVEWIGEIPEHWEVMKMNNVCKVITDFVASGSFADLRNNVQYLDEPDYALLVRTADLSQKNKDVQPVYVSKDSYEFLSNSNLYGGEIILPNIGASIGDVYMVPNNLYDKMTLGPNAILLRTKYNDKFFYYYFMSKGGRESLVLMGQAAAQSKFNKTELRQMKVILPPLNEQNSIVQEIENKIKPADNAITKALRQIELLKEYKQSLITEVVTGKRKVC